MSNELLGYSVKSRKGIAMEDKIFQRIDCLMKDQGKRMKDLLTYLGLSHSTYDNWKTGKSKSYLKYIEKIGEFLHVTPNYIVTGTDMMSSIPDELEAQEEELKSLFRQVTSETREYVLKIMRLNVEMLQKGTIQ